MQITIPFARRAAVAAAALSLAACADNAVQPSDPVAPPPPATAIETLACTASVNPLRVSCASPQAQDGGPSRLIVGRQGVYVFLASSNVSYDPVGDTLSADVTVRNLLSQPMATTNGAAPDPAGVRVFFTAGPTAPVAVAADGVGTFTASNQPYYQYGPAEFGNACCLAPQATTLPRRWKFAMNGATSFSFSAQVAAAIPVEGGVLRWMTDFDPAAPPNHGQPVLDVWGDFTIGGAVWSAGAVGSLGRRTSGAWGTVALANGPGDRVLRFFRPLFFGLWGVAANGTFYHEASDNFAPVYVGVTGMRDIHGTDSTNIWAAGDSGRVLRYRGSAWGRVTQPGTANLRAVFSYSSTDVWVGGEGGAFHHWNGTGWTVVAAPDSGTVNDIWGYSGGLWAVNVQQTGSGPVSSIFRYSGGAWSVEVPSLPVNLRSIHGVTAGFGPPFAVYAVGGNLLLCYNGSAWFQEYVPLAAGDTLYSVHAISNRYAAAGGIGTVYIGTP